MYKLNDFLREGECQIDAYGKLVIKKPFNELDPELQQIITSYNSLELFKLYSETTKQVS
jgi:hypothetical protein